MTVPDEVRERIESDPFCEYLGIDLVALREGYARTELTVTEELTNFHGTPHGGAVYSLADAAFAAASNSRGDTALALEVNMSYLDAVDVGTTLVATAEETHLSTRTAEYEVVVAEPDGGRVATFRGRVYITRYKNFLDNFLVLTFDLKLFTFPLIGMKTLRSDL